jgi:hypothetical protein
MLVLKRIQYFTDIKTCKVSGELISHGQFYYEDDTDGVVVKASVYRDLKDKYAEDNFDNSRLERAQSEADYKTALRRYEQEFLSRDVLSRQIQGKEIY